jgi:hypothetical protein
MFNAIYNQNPKGISCKVDNMILNYIWKIKESKIAQTILGKE